MDRYLHDIDMSLSSEVSRVALSSDSETEAPSVRRVLIIANTKSGAATGNEAATEVCEALRERGCDAEVWPVTTAADLQRRLRAAREAAPDVIAICGGDGSVNAAAEALANSGIILGIVPQGTFNYVARRYKLPDEPEAIAALLATGTAIDIGAGCVNDHRFLNNCSIGLYTDVIEARERHTARWGRMRIVAVISALMTALRPPARLRMRVFDAVGTTRFEGRASLVFVGVNPLQFERAGLPALAQTVAKGALGAVLVRAVSPWRLLPLVLGAAVGRLAVLDEIEPASAAAFSIELQRRWIEAVVDGETIRLQSPLRFSYQPGVLRLMVPANALSEH
jgi:diacylglycerol kinase family enzyme